MPHELSDEDLCAYLDSELPAEARAGVSRHLGSCAACVERLDELRAASAEFKKSGAETLPEGLQARVLAAARGGPARRASVRQWAYAISFAAAAAFTLASGIMVKWYAPQLFQQIQEMVGKAAGSLGR